MSENSAEAAAPVLVVLAHPALERSRANQAMARAAETLPGVAVHDLYEEYPAFLIDVPAEQARLRAAEHIVLQFPLYWYSTPALLKEWIDTVWLHGFAYGRGAECLAGKTLMVACSAGSPESDYAPGGAHHFSLEELLRPLERTAALCRMRWEKPFILHNSRVASPAALAAAVADYAGRLTALAGIDA